MSYYFDNPNYPTGKYADPYEGYAYDVWDEYTGVGNYVSRSYTTPTYRQTSTPVKPPRELVKSLASQMSAIYNSKEEAIENKENKDMAYFMGNDGWYVIAHYMLNGNKVKICTKVKDNPLSDEVETGIIYFDPIYRIPVSLLKELVGNFAWINDKQHTECAAQIYKKNDTGEYWIYYPKQIVSGAHVAYDKDPKPRELRNDNTLIMEIHSHDTMGAFWSGEDNRNENETGMYMVLGTFGSASASYKARIKSGDIYEDMSATKFFEMTEEEEKEILKRENWRAVNPENLFNQIEKTAPTTTYSWNKYTQSKTTTQYVAKTDIRSKTTSSTESTSLWDSFLEHFCKMWNKSSISTGNGTAHYSKNCASFIKGNAAQVVVNPSKTCPSEEALAKEPEVLDSTAYACTAALSNVSSVARSGNEVESSEDFKAKIGGFSIDYLEKTLDIGDFWELLMGVEKARLNMIFMCPTITDLGNEFYRLRDSVEQVNPCLVVFLYKIILAPKDIFIKIRDNMEKMYPKGVTLEELNNDLIGELEEE